MVYICITNKWRDVFKPEMTKVKEISLLLNEILSTTYPEVYEHLVKTSMLDVDQMIQLLFSSQIITIFIADLYEES